MNLARKAELYVKVNPKAAESGARRVNKSLRGIHTHADKATKSLTLMQKALVYVSFAGAAFAAIKFGQALLTASNTMESYNIRLKAMLGSQREGNELFRSMTKFAVSVPFTYEKIMSSATALSGVMFGGVKQIEKWMPLTADLAAVTGLSIEQTTGQIIRMYAAGAASADLFRERGVLAMLGFTPGEFYSAAQTRKKLWEAYDDPQSKFKGATTDLAKTFLGKMSMMEDAWFLLKNRIANSGFSDIMKNQVDNITEGLRTVKRDFETYSKGAGHFSNLIAAFVILKVATYAQVTASTILTSAHTAATGANARLLVSTKGVALSEGQAAALRTANTASLYSYGAAVKANTIFAKAGVIANTAFARSMSLIKAASPLIIIYGLIEAYDLLFNSTDKLLKYNEALIKSTEKYSKVMKKTNAEFARERKDRDDKAASLRRQQFETMLEDQKRIAEKIHILDVTLNPKGGSYLKDDSIDFSRLFANLKNAVGLEPSPVEREKGIQQLIDLKAAYRDVTSSIQDFNKAKENETLTGKSLSFARAAQVKLANEVTEEYFGKKTHSQKQKELKRREMDAWNSARKSGDVVPRVYPNGNAYEGAFEDRGKDGNIKNIYESEDYIEKVAKPFAAARKKLNDELYDSINKKTLSKFENERIAAEREIEVWRTALGVRTEDNKKYFDKIDAFEIENKEDSLRREKEYNEKIAQQKLDASVYWQDGVKRATKSFYEDAQNDALQYENFTTSTFQNMEDAIVKFATTGKINFSDFANSVISDLVRIYVKQKIIAPFAQSLGLGADVAGGGGGSAGGVSLGSSLAVYSGNTPVLNANGGIMTPSGALNLNAYANGGIANSPQLAIFGEGRQNEAYVPLPDGRTIPVTLNGQQEQQQTGNTYNISVEYSPDLSSIDPSKASEVIAENAPVVEGIIREAMAKVGQEANF